MKTVKSGYADVQDGLYESAERALPGAGLGGYSLPENVRFVINGARGARLISAEGREYIDYVGGAGANILGANHPKVVEAVQRQAARGLHFFGTLNSTAIELADRLRERYFRRFGRGSQAPWQLAGSVSGASSRRMRPVLEITSLRAFGGPLSSQNVIVVLLPGALPPE